MCYIHIYIYIYDTCSEAVDCNGENFNLPSHLTITDRISDDGIAKNHRGRQLPWNYAVYMTQT